MEMDHFHRKLAAILNADVAGFSRLMQDDEAATVMTLDSYKRIIADLVEQHRGRVVDSPGDNLLADFASVVDAVQCAVATQKEIAARNSSLAENRRMLFRIGVNLGDVIEDGSRIFGDGVNIAARLEALAEPGGICISRTAYDHIESKLPYGYAYIGEQKIKNISRPIGAYKILLDPLSAPAKPFLTRFPSGKGRRALIALAALALTAGAVIWGYHRHERAFEPAAAERMAFPLPDMPSIAVLTFSNHTRDRQMDLLCDGIAGSVIAALSRYPDLLVIARDSVLPFKDKPEAPGQASERLGVQYVLDGNLQPSGDRIRVTARLLDATKGTVVWAETFDHDPGDPVAVQDDIAIQALIALRGKTIRDFSPTARRHFKGRQGLDCYLKIIEAGTYVQKWNLRDNNLARYLLEEARSMCPDVPQVYSTLGWVYHHAYFFDDSMPRQEALEKSIELAGKAIEMDDSLSDPHNLLCDCYMQRLEYEKALAECRRAVSLAPGGMNALTGYGWILLRTGRNEEALQVFQRAHRLNPYGKSSLYRGIGAALIFEGRAEEAIPPLKAGIQRSPDDYLTHVYLAGAYGLAGYDKEAALEAAEVLRIYPGYSLKNRFAGFQQERRDALMDALRKAGIP